MLTQAQLTREKKRISKKCAQYPSFSFQGLRNATRRYDSNLFSSSLADENIPLDLFDGPDNFEDDGCLSSVSFTPLRKRRRIHQDEVRIARGRNWEKIEPWMAALMLGRPPLGESKSGFCGCKPYTVEVRVISLQEYQRERITYCRCGLRCAQLVSRGLFPSTPINPKTVFSVRLLELLHSVCVRGSCSKYAWAEGLRECLENLYLQEIPPFHRAMRDAYMHFISTSSVRDSLFAQHTFPPAEEKLANLCPACFDFSVPGEGVKAAFLSVDGNMQHTRFKDARNPMQFERFPFKTVINYGIRSFPLAPGTIAAASKRSPCGHLFKATKEWVKSEEISTSSGPVKDEKGIVSAVCHHGIPLRYQNIYSGERQTHMTSLLEHILRELDAEPSSNGVKIRLSYDVACIFGPALHKIMPEYADRIDSKIGRFHIYGHGIRCQVLYNILRSPGWGLQIGEENEYDWVRLAHFVASGRILSGPRRSLVIDDYCVFMARHLKERFGTILSQKLKRSTEVGDEAEQVLARILGKAIPARDELQRPAATISPEYLALQASHQADYYRNDSTPDDLRDKIFQSLADEARLLHNHSIRHGAIPTLMSFESGRKAMDKTASLLRKCGDSREAWLPGTELYKAYEIRNCLATLRKHQTKLIEIVTARNQELEALHRRVRGQRDAKKFLAQINKRWTALDTVVKQYNKEVEKLGGAVPNRPRKLDLRELKESGIACDQLWDVDRLRTLEDWAVMKDVRDGIDVSFRAKRAAEELQMLQLHAVRIIHWLNIQADALLKITSDSGLTDRYVKIRLLQRLRMVRSMLNIKHHILVDEASKAGLISLEIRIMQHLSAVELVGQDQRSVSGDGEPGDQEAPVDEDESDEDDVGVVDDDDDEAFEVLESKVVNMGDSEEVGIEVAEEDAETDTVRPSTEVAE